MDRLTTRGRAVRVAATLLVAGVLVAGTVRGQDDAFPFGPFRMYATTDPPDAPVRDTRVAGVDASGRRIALTERATGVRRAEIEGRLDGIRRDPALLRSIADAYDRRHPDRPDLVQVSVVVRWHELSGGRPTGAVRDETVATWRAP